ncbi:hypothetical protein [Ligilactobacillus sp.]|uniref:hypothetical protein n=1 Tax=Ligilactobacillus sp. TaxID=2767921 RepID=UPI002FDF5FEC
MKKSACYLVELEDYYEILCEFPPSELGIVRGAEAIIESEKLSFDFFAKRQKFATIEEYSYLFPNKAD